MDTYTATLTCCIKPFNRRLAILVCVNTSHCIMHSRSDLNRFMHRVHPGKVYAKLAHHREFFLYLGLAKVSQIQMDVRTVRPVKPAACPDFLYDGTGDNITWGKLHFRRCILLHKPLAFIIKEITAFTACGLCNQYACLHKT